MKLNLFSPFKKIELKIEKVSRGMAVTYLEKVYRWWPGWFPRKTNLRIMEIFCHLRNLMWPLKSPSLFYTQNYLQVTALSLSFTKSSLELLLLIIICRRTDFSQSARDICFLNVSLPMISGDTLIRYQNDKLNIFAFQLCAISPDSSVQLVTRAGKFARWGQNLQHSTPQLCNTFQISPNCKCFAWYCFHISLVWPPITDYESINIFGKDGSLVMPCIQDHNKLTDLQNG